MFTDDKIIIVGLHRPVLVILKRLMDGGRWSKKPGVWSGL